MIVSFYSSVCPFARLPIHSVSTTPNCSIDFKYEILKKEMGIIRGYDYDNNNCRMLQPTVVNSRKEYLNNMCMYTSYENYSTDWNKSKFKRKIRCHLLDAYEER